MDPQALPESPHVITSVFNGNSAVNGQAWHTWTKPAGKSMASFVVIGAGGGGGTGAIGAVSAAAGGGGGASGNLTVVEIPLSMIPSRLYISVGMASVGVTPADSIVATHPLVPIQTGDSHHMVAYASAGGPGGNASGATAGTAGAPNSFSPTPAHMLLGGVFMRKSIQGQAGIAGGTTGAGAALTLPLTGLRMTGGTGGGGVGASGNGLAGGAFTVPASPSYFPAHTGGIAPTATTTPPGVGRSGFAIRDAGTYYYGGTGGASTHATATGAGLVQARGGNGGIGCGGGGSGGAKTGSTAATGGYGGPGLVIITCY